MRESGEWVGLDTDRNLLSGQKEPMKWDGHTNIYLWKNLRGVSGVNSLYGRRGTVLGRIIF